MQSTIATQRTIRSTVQSSNSVNDYRKRLGRPRIQWILILSACTVLFSWRASAEESTLVPKSILVTGASSGIGLQITKTLAANGFHVYAGARRQEDLSRLAKIANVSPVKLDVTVQEDIDAAAIFVEQQGRGLWGIVNNAGIGRFAPVASGPIENIQSTFDVNVFGPYRINKAFLPLVIESGGRTAIVGSINGFVPATHDAGYTASKFAVEGYTDSLSAELLSTGVRVAIIEPGAFKSNFRNTLVSHAIEMAERGQIELDEQTGRQLSALEASNDSLKEPVEVAHAALHFMSSEVPKSRYLVTSNLEEALLALRWALGRAAQLNDGQPYSLDQVELVSLFEDVLEELGE